MVGITVLAGTQEAARQFDGLKSSLKNFTRASLWSGLIVYAQPVSDGKLPTPQIYYLMPASQPQQPAAPAAQQAILADNGATTAKPEARNNHGGEAAAANPEAMALVATRELEDVAESELTLHKLPLNLIASNLVAPKIAPRPDRVRVYEEVAKNETHAARKFKHDADTAFRVFVKDLKDLKDFDGEKLVAETERIADAHAQLEHLKLKAFVEAANMHRRMDVRVVRPAPRPEHLERIRVINPSGGTRGVTLPAMSSIGCEKTRVTPKAAPVPAAPTRVAKANAKSIGETPSAPGLPAAPYSTGNSWSLNCDTEPEQK
ncbi:MAG TPA: hypothetical protein VK388_08100 [Pyrinomonadaceae bacterium]|nr:hypothetical protein [Pyrinomonadaceae bacterium]